jgi:hypothetical protein
MDDREDYEPPPFLLPPRPRVLHRVTLAVCAAGAVAEPALWAASAGGLSGQDVAIFLLLSAPYLFLSLYVWLQRRRTAASWVLLASTVVLAVVGLAVAGVHAYRSLLSGTPAPNRDAGLGLVACFKWLMVFVFGALSVVVSAIASAGQDQFAPRPERRPRRRPMPREDDDD